MPNHLGDALGAVCAVRLSDRDCVLHAFQTKSNGGVAMSDGDVDSVKRRLTLAAKISGTLE